MKNVLLVLALIVSLVGSVSAAPCKGKAKGNRAAVNRQVNVGVAVNRNRNRGVRTEVIGNQLLTFDAAGNVLNRQFVNNRNGVNAGVGIGVGAASLADRLLGF